MQVSNFYKVFFIIEDFLIDFFLRWARKIPQKTLAFFQCPQMWGTEPTCIFLAGEVIVYGATCSALTKFGQNLSSMICRIYFARKQLELPTDLENKMNDKGNRLKSKQPVTARCSCFWKWVFKCWEPEQRKKWKDETHDFPNSIIPRFGCSIHKPSWSWSLWSLS